jgi:hypothetical protein
MSLPEAIIAQIQDPRLSDVDAFNVYLDYITVTDAEKRFAHLDPNEHSFAQVLTAFRNWFSPNSDEFKAFMGRLTWDRKNIKCVQPAKNVYTWVISALSSVGKNYFNYIVASFPFATVKPRGSTLLDCKMCIATSKRRGYFFLKLAVELDANILHSRRNGDAPCHIQLEDAWNEDGVDKFKLFLEFVDRECKAPYMV